MFYGTWFEHTNSGKTTLHCGDAAFSAVQHGLFWVHRSFNTPGKWSVTADNGAALRSDYKTKENAIQAANILSKTVVNEKPLSEEPSHEMGYLESIFGVGKVREAYDSVRNL